MTDCVFCAILNRSIPSYPVYEDDDVYAFLDLNQTTKGHTLVIPKKHIPDIFACQPADAAALFSRVPKIARALEQAFPDMQGLNIINNNKETAYQSVFHLHVHLIPRYGQEDDFSIHFGHHPKDYTTDQMQQIAQEIRKQVTE